MCFLRKMAEAPNLCVSGDPDFSTKGQLPLKSLHILRSRRCWTPLRTYRVTVQGLLASKSSQPGPGKERILRGLGASNRLPMRQRQTCTFPWLSLSWNWGRSTVAWRSTIVIGCWPNMEGPSHEESLRSGRSIFSELTVAH